MVKMTFMRLGARNFLTLDVKDSIENIIPFCKY